MNNGMSRQSSVPWNVCFHGIGSPGRKLEPGEAEFWVAEHMFDELLDEISTWPRANISFDDGNSSDIEIAMDGLLQRGLTATFFVLAGRFDEAGSLDRSQIRELHRSGMTIGSHGMAHRSWRELDSAARRHEFVDARNEIAEACGAPVATASVPLGQYDRTVLSQLRSLDYAQIFTSDRRLVDPNAWLQARFSVRSGDSPARLRSEIERSASPVRRARRAAIGLFKRLR